jgi:hypothetical protein
VITTRSRSDGTFAIRGLDPGPWDVTAFLQRFAEKFTTATPARVDLGASPVSIDLPLVPAVLTSVSLVCSRRGPIVETPSTRPIRGLTVILEDTSGKPLATCSPLDRDSIGVGAGLAPVPTFSCGMWTAPQAVKVIVRQNSKIVGTGEGVAGTEIRLTVTVD